MLLGGGHAHALVIAGFRMAPLPGVRLTLISPEAHTPYSGMLPGLVAGLYHYDETHIDLDRLCALSGVRFICAAATGLDLPNKAVLFDDRPPLAFDLLSVNVGATPELAVPGAALHALPVKPISRFYPRWLTVRAALARQPAPRLAIAGGGAAALELSAAIKAALPAARVDVFFPEALPLAGYSENLRRRAAREYQALGINLHPGRAIESVQARQLFTADGAQAFDELFWCAQAGPPHWLAALPLAKDERGFLQVNAQLQSPSLPWLFGAGDCVALQGQPRPKAGVYAVRAAPVLLHNLRAALLGQPLRRFRAQAAFLSLLSLGDGRALASRYGGWLPSLVGAWVWRWKDRIDRRFMAMFSELAPMPVTDAEPPAALWGEQAPDPAALAMRCGGCGAKVGGELLAGVLADLQPVARAGVDIGLNDPDDAAVLRLPPARRLVQSVDQFRALLDDPWLQGRVAALHALSDLHAMGAEPHSAQALVTLPYARPALVQRDLGQLMQGALSELNAAHCQLLGGHTGEGAELAMGFVVNGLAGPALLTKAGLQVNDRLLVTKRLGTGTLFAARARGLARGRWITAATAQMLQSNGPAAQILQRHGARACTDITGFGLGGHLMEMLRASHLSARLWLDRLPVLEGALDCLQAGVVSSLYGQNQRLRNGLADPAALADPRVRVLFDPQTAGGLLVGLPAPYLADAMAALQAVGIECFEVGKVLPQQAWLIETVEANPAG